MKYNVTHRTCCRFCGSQQTVCYYSLPNLPMTDSFVTSTQLGQEFVHPIDVYFCRDCHLSQTLHDVDTEGYYDEYQYSVAVSPLAQSFMRRLAQEIWCRYGFVNGDSVVEVGSSDGSQLSYFRELGARVFGFEPSSHLVKISGDRGITVSHRLFDEQAGQEIPIDHLPVQVILLTYTFDHLPEPRSFLSSVRKILDPQRGVLAIEVHDLEKIIERREFCLFEHEHTSYYTAATLQAVLAQAGFRLLDIGLLPESERRGNSLLVTATPIGSALEQRAFSMVPEGLYADSEHYLAFGRGVQASQESLRGYIRSRRDCGARLAGYGAGGRGVITLAACARPGDFTYVVDQNPAFHGYCTPVAHVPVDAPARLRSEPVDEVIVFSFGYFREICSALADVRASGTKFTSLLDLL